MENKIYMYYSSYNKQEFESRYMIKNKQRINLYLKEQLPEYDKLYTPKQLRTLVSRQEVGVECQGNKS